MPAETIVRATSALVPTRIAAAPSRPSARAVRHRCLAASLSTTGTPEMSISTTRALRLLTTPSRTVGIAWARAASIVPTSGNRRMPRSGAAARYRQTLK